MAKFKAIPNYEFIRPGVYIQFDYLGHFETNKESEVKLLESLSPFIKRIDKLEDKPKPKQKSTRSSVAKSK